VERRRTVGLVTPDLDLYAELTAAENLAFFAKLRGTPAERGAELLARVGLAGERLAGELSSGMRQRLRWAWALLHRPPVLLLDEPLQNLDAAGRDAVLGLLRDHLDGGGLAVVANPDPLETGREPLRLALGG
jgi:heme exporter protein A